jgi:uncharacterized protein (TIGR03067 family)
MKSQAWWTLPRVVWCLALCTLGCSGPSAKEPTPSAKTDSLQKDDLAKLQGGWIITQAEQGGMAIPAQLFKKVHLRVSDDHYTLVFADQSEKGTLSLDSSKKPKTIDSNISEGRDRGHRQHGIYELDGNRFKVCWARVDQPRPTAFKTKPVNRSPLLGNALFVFERTKKD